MKRPAPDTEPIPWARPAIDRQELNAVIACMKSGWLTCGPRVEQFETEMAARVGRKFAVAVTNGTAALDLSLRVLGITQGDEVIVPALSYVATAAAVAIVGATPVFADIDRRNLSLDPAAADSLITSQTRAILCTDHGGNPCDYPKLTALADRNRIALILDGAQSIGALFDGKPVLSFGLLSTVSFHAAKTMTTIEGGMVFTDDETLNRRMRMIRSQGEDPKRKYHHIELGNNFRMTELQAAIGLSQLSKLDQLLQDRQKLAAQYHALLDPLGLNSPPGLPTATDSHFLYSVLAPRRDEIVARLKERGIDTRICYPLPLYAQPIFERYRGQRCPITEETCASIFNPPMFHGLKRAQQSRIARELAAAMAELTPGQLRQAV